MRRARHETRGVVFGSLMVDLILGEPPSALHPTVWMGQWISAGRGEARPELPAVAFIEGLAIVVGGVIVSGIAGSLGARAVRSTAHRFGIPMESALLKCTLSVRALLAAAAEVERALEAGNLSRARQLLGYHLVSRDTRHLTESEVAGAAIESLAENLSDGIVAPLLAYRGGGLSAAYAYRFLNTADAMLGYRTAEFEWIGKTAALSDDLANFLPARLTACLIVMAAGAWEASAGAAVRSILADANSTASPNAGWPMAAMAGTLGVRLDKRGAYVLNARGRLPLPRDIARARRIVLTATLAAVCLMEVSLA